VQSFVPPNVPVLLQVGFLYLFFFRVESYATVFQILSGAHTAQDLMPKGSVIEVNLNHIDPCDFLTLSTASAEQGH
jgi:hypothetical protein